MYEIRSEQVASWDSNRYFTVTWEAETREEADNIARDLISDPFVISVEVIPPKEEANAI